MTVTGVRPPGRFGEMEINPDGLITEFNEKPQATGGWISGGFFVCRPEVFEYLGEGEDLGGVRDPCEQGLQGEAGSHREGGECKDAGSCEGELLS